MGAVEADSPGLFRSAKLYIGEIENRYLTGEVRRKVIYHLYKLPQVTINNEKVLLHDDETFEIDGIKIECFLVPGHTWGHMVYLIDDKYLFTGDTIWFGADGGYSFISSLAEDNKLAVKSLAALEQKLQSRGLHPKSQNEFKSFLKGLKVIAEDFFDFSKLIIYCIAVHKCFFLLKLICK